MILGCANQAGEDNRNVARMAALLAGLPVEVAGQTVNRLCGSGLQAVNAAAHAIMVGDGDVFVAGGVETMTRAPYVMLKPEAPSSAATREMADTTLGWRFTNPGLAEMHHPYSMGETAENVAERWTRQPRGPGRVRARSPAARRGGHRGRPLRRPDRAGDRAPAQGRARSSSIATSIPRADTTIEALARLQAGLPRGRHGHRRQQLGHQRRRRRAASWSRPASPASWACKPLARVVTTAVAGVDPAVMGLGPIPATRKALERAGLSVEDLDLVELNEAFASQSIACIRELGLDPAKVNVNGGAIALGHPLGMSGAAWSRRWSTSSPRPAAATAWRRCASASARASPRSSSGSIRRQVDRRRVVAVAICAGIVVGCGSAPTSSPTTAVGPTLVPVPSASTPEPPASSDEVATAYEAVFLRLKVVDGCPR